MEFGKSMDVSCFDWDDTALIKAYDRGMRLTKKSLSKSKENKNASNKEKSKTAKQWSIGDYCRAVYPVDGLFYEAKILDMLEDSCSVEYLGYNDDAEVAIKSLKESLGKNARRKQKKKAIESDTACYSSETDQSNGTDIRKIREEVKQLRGQFGQQQPEFYDYTRPQQAQPYTQPHHPVATTGQEGLPNIQRVDEGMQFLPQFAPPMPQCPSISRDSALSSMLISWYMAGYYTGLHQNQRANQCQMPSNRQCCDHQGPPSCCHH